MKRRSWFTRSQLWFLLIVLNVCLLLLVALFLSHYRNGRVGGIAETMNEVSGDRPASGSSQYYAVEASQPESFPFDPNEADSTQLLRLGLAPFQVRSIYRYRAKGGRFSTKDDFRRVYRLTNEQWERLSPLICIDRKYQLVSVVEEDDKGITAKQSHSQSVNTSQVPSSCVADTPFVRSAETKYPVKLSGDETVDINTADSILFCRVPGIGPYFSRKILQYRRRLGGYVSTAQLLEIEDFPADAISWMVVNDTSVVQKLSVNHQSVRKLMKHPYMGYYRASEIADYRRVHGPIRSIEVLITLPHFSDDDIRRLAPYLSFD